MNKKTYAALAAIALLLAVFVTALGAVSVQAKDKDKGKANGPKKIEWSQSSLQAQVNKGATVQTTVTFTPTVNITNGAFRVTASLSDTVTLEPSSFATLTAGTPYQITVTFTAPTEGGRKKYHGVAALVDETKLYAKPLKLRFGVNKE